MPSPRFHFVEGDISINQEWVEYHIKKCDVVLPLVAIANPAQYVHDPLRVFELDFEANLAVVRQCVSYRKRLDVSFDVRGVRHVVRRRARRRIEPARLRPHSQAALDLRGLEAAARSRDLRVRRKRSFDYTLFRPFNFIGPNLDNIEEPKEGSSRVFTQFLSNVMHQPPDQARRRRQQKRSFTYIDDAVDCLLRIIENRDQRRDASASSTSAIPRNCVSVAISRSA